MSASSDSQFLRAPARRLGPGADLPQNQEPRQHLVLAAAEQRDESVEGLSRPEQREQGGQIGRLPG